MGIFKTLLLAVIWTLVTWWFPQVSRPESLSTWAVVLGFQRFILMLILCMLFDQRDVEADRLMQRSSAATVFSSTLFNRMMTLLLIFLFGVHQWAYAVGLPQAVWLGWQVLTLILAGLCFWQRQRKPAPAFYLVVVDGMMLLFAVISGF
jgi:hypothetical protein